MEESRALRGRTKAAGRAGTRRGGERTSSWYGIKSNPYLLMVAGLILAYPAAAISFDIGDLGFISLLPWIPSAILFTFGSWQLQN